MRAEVTASRACRRSATSRTPSPRACAPARRPPLVWRIQELAAAHRRAINAHIWSSALVLAASVHLSAAASNSLLIELKALPNPMQHELTITPLIATGGWLDVSDRPGLGVEIDEAVVARYVDR